MNSVTKQQILQIIPKWGGWLIGIGLIVRGAFLFLRMRKVYAEGGDPITVLFIFFFAAACVTAGLFLFSPYVIEKISRLVTGLLYPSAWLEKPAPMLSPIQGKITAGKFNEALEDLQNHIEKYPTHATAYLILADLYKMNLNDPVNAQKTVLSYLNGTARTPGDDAVRLALRNVDYLVAQKKKTEAFEFLKNEAQKRCYSANERQSLLKRMNYISVSLKGN